MTTNANAVIIIGGGGAGVAGAGGPATGTPPEIEPKRLTDRNHEGGLQ